MLLVAVYLLLVADYWLIAEDFLFCKISVNQLQETRNQQLFSILHQITIKITDGE